ncbi:DUF2345 domain-containing protein [Chromobacterium sp. Beijing]|uniref:DUF2345 domain-containing protein n=1 Tax=Chromobacterium sp. Beijing TaxID=2735795 RepID=UPI00351D383A
MGWPRKPASITTCSPNPTTQPGKPSSSATTSTPTSAPAAIPPSRPGRRQAQAPPQAGIADNEETLSRFELAAQPIRARLQRKDYNYRDANQPLLAEGGPPAKTPGARGVDYQWGEHYKDPEQGQRAVLIAQQREHCRQWIAAGDSNCLQAFAPGQIFKHDGPALAPAPDGWLLVSVRHQGGRRDAYRNAFTATPADRPYRQERLTPVPRLSGALPSRVVAPEKTYYGAIDLQGRYCVRLPFDLDEWSPGGDSRPLRLARPYAGPEYGLHFPLHPGTEVLVSFVLGDVDRPYISGCLHNSELTDSNPGAHWDSRNLIRTWANNKLRLEDRKGQEHIKLATEFDKSQLNLGHAVDGQRAPRGEGFELRTDGWGALRAAKGLFLSTDAQPKARGKQLDMQAALDQLEEAAQLVDSLRQAAQQAQAELADIGAQTQLLQQTLAELKQPALLAHAPAGIALATPAQLQLAAGQNLAFSAGAQADVSVLKRFTVAAGESISLFAQKLGLKLIANQGAVTMQAQNGPMQLHALESLNISSSSGKIAIAAKEELTLLCGGAYLRLKQDGTVEIGSPGNHTVKARNWTVTGPDQLQAEHPAYPKTLLKEALRIKLSQGPEAAAQLAGMPYTLLADGQEVSRGVLDAQGRLAIAHDAVTARYSVRLANGATVILPVLTQYQDDEQDPLANLGLHPQDYNISRANENGDAQNLRRRYARLLFPPPPDASGDAK